VTETFNLAAAQKRTIHDAGVVFFIENDNVILANQSANGAQVHLHAGGKHQRGFHANPFCQLSLQIFNQGHVSVQETRAGAAGAVFRDCVHGRFTNLWMRGQAQVIVGAAHNNPATLVQHLGAFILVQRNKVGISPSFPGIANNFEIQTFLKDIHLTLFQLG